MKKLARGLLLALFLVLFVSPAILAADIDLIADSATFSPTMNTGH